MSASYKAFISYSHAADGKLSPAVQSAIHRLAKPWYRVRAARVFRDKTSLSANPGLWSAIERALDRSEFFLLFASPAAARSAWVTKEVLWWLDNRKADSILLLVTGGSLAWEEAALDFDWSATDCLPACLKGRFQEEPLYVDLRWAKGENDLSLRHAQFRAAMLDIAATLHGKDKEEIDSEDVREHRRFRLAAWTSVVLLIALAGISTFAMLRARTNARIAEERRRDAVASQRLAEERRREAEDARAEAERRRAAEAAARLAEQQQRLEAERRTRIAAARYLSSEALRETNAYPIRNLALALEAAHTTLERDGDVIPAAEQSIRAALRFVGGMPLGAHGARVNAVAFSPDGRWMATVSGNRRAEKRIDNSIRLWDLTRAPPSQLAMHNAEYPLTGVMFAGGLLLTAAFNGIVYRWTVPDLKPAGGPKLVEGANRLYPYSATVFDVDGARLAVGGGPGQSALSLRGLGDRRVDSTFSGPSGVIMSIALSRRMAAVGKSDRNIVIWKMDRALSPAATVAAPSVPYSLAFDPEGGRLIAGLGDGSVRLWKVSDGGVPTDPPVVVHTHQSPVLVTRFSADGQWIASGSGDRDATPARDYSVRISRINGDGVEQSFTTAAHEAALLSLAFSPDGRWLASGAADGSVRLFDWRRRDTRTDPRELRGHTAAIEALAFSRDGRWLASGTGSQFRISRDPMALLWNVEGMQEGGGPIRLNGESAVNSVAFSPDGRWLATGGSPPRLWDIASAGAEHIRLQNGSAPADMVAFSPDGKWFAAACRDSKARLWKTTGADFTQPTRILTGHRSLLVCLRFSPDSRWLVTGAQDRTALLWDLRADASKPPYALEGYRHFIVQTAFSRDGRWLAAASGQSSERGRREQRGQSTVIVWELGRGQPRQVKLEGHLDDVLDVSFSRDSAWLATASMDGTARLWRVATFGPRAESFELPGHNDVVTAARFSPAGDRLATAGMDGTVRFWNVRSPQPGIEPVVLDHPGNVLALEFSPDGRWLATGAVDGVTRLWRVRLAEILELAKTIAGRGLTAEERRQFLGGTPAQFHQ